MRSKYQKRRLPDSEGFIENKYCINEIFEIKLNVDDEVYFIPFLMDSIELKGKITKILYDTNHYKHIVLIKGDNGIQWEMEPNQVVPASLKFDKIEN